MYTLHKSDFFKQQVMDFALNYKATGGVALANRFLDEVEKALEFISADPFACGLYHEAKLHILLQRDEFRRWSLQHFPHSIYFRLSNKIITLELIYAQAMNISKRMKNDMQLK